MTQALHQAIVPTTSDSPHRVVLCGSFRRDREGLAATFSELLDHFEVLSPLGVNFTNPSDEFVRLPHESTDSQTEIEQRHLDALIEADFVWLHAPEGYIGTSAMFELGHAKALGIPVFSSHVPNDVTFAPWVTVVASPSEVVLDQAHS